MKELSNYVFRENGKIEVIVGELDTERGFINFKYRNGKERKVDISPIMWEGAHWTCWEEE